MRLWMVLAIILLVAQPAIAGLTAGDIVVVYNSSTLEDEEPYDWTVSKRVADYYCTERHIPFENQCGVKWAHPGESMSPQEFYDNIQLPLEAFLHEHFHSDEVPIGEDPIKAIVLCYGVPMVIAGGERCGSVDSTLSLLFNRTPWGMCFQTDLPNRCLT